MSYEKLKTVMLALVTLALCCLVLLVAPEEVAAAERDADAECVECRELALKRRATVAVRVQAAPSREEVMAQFTEEERHALAKLLWGEARGIESDTEKAAVIWCVLNRVDSDDPYYLDTILGVVKQKGQFAGYNAGHPVDEHLLALVDDVLYRWATGGEGRVLPEDYLFFASKASEGFTHNYFRRLFNDPGPRWDWSLPSPYES